jgi:hypothetical protein
MDTKNRVTVDIVSILPDGSYALNLVEQGPWSDDTQKELRRIQDRLYNCFDAFVDGQVFEKYPESKGKKGIIRLACYDLASKEIDPFFQRFTDFVNSSDEYQGVIERSEFISSIEFSVTYDKTNDTTDRDRTAHR